MLVLKYLRKRTYHMFLEENPGCTISKTTFDKLKPKALKLMKHAKWLQCICGVCDNISMVCRAIRLSMYRSNMEVPTQLNSELELAKHAVCDFGNYECLDRKCDGCSVSKLSGLLAEWVSDNPSELIRYHRWKTVTETVGGKAVSKLRKVESTGQRWMLYNELDKDLQTFPLHLFNAISQLSAFKKCKQSLKSNQVVVIADFAENYKCRQWSEEQACYYVRNSATLHPLVLVSSEGSEVKRDSVVILSDDLSHDHAAVKSFIQVLSQHISMTYPHISELIIWSDGCSAQYKSRLPMMNLSQCFGTHYNITWNFFGSRHGKGESDGESAVCKSYLDTSVKSEQQTIHDAHSAFKFLQKSDRNKPDGPSRRHFYFVKSADIQTIRQLSPLTKDVLAIPRIRDIHHAVGGGNSISYARSSCYCPSDECQHRNQSYRVFKYPG